MSHSHYPSYDQTEPDVFASSASIVITGFLLVAVVLGSYVFYKSTVSDELARKQDTPKPQVRVQLENYETQQLNNLTWLNKSKGEVKVPIDVAKRLIIKDYK